MPQNDGTIQIDEARIVFRNFSGREDQFNAEGDRNFSVLLDDDLAEQLIKDGWNVKELRAREEGDTPQKYLPVSVKYRGRNGSRVRPPTIVLITSKGRTHIGEDLVDTLDFVDIERADIIIRPYEWVMRGKTGIKAYVKDLYVIVAESALERRYSDIPEIGAGRNNLALEAGSDPNVIDVEWEDVDDQRALER